MKVLQVVEATTAGVGRHVLGLSVHMQRAGVDVTVACPQVRDHARHDTSFVDDLVAAGVRVVEVPMRYGIHPLADLRDYGRLVRLIRSRGYDVIHAHSSKAGALGRLSAKHCHVPAVVYTPNAFAFLGAPNGFLRWLYLRGEQYLGRGMTDRLICVSHSERALASQMAIVPPERLVTIENAIDASLYAPTMSQIEAKAALDLDPERMVVGYVGRLARQKGIEYLLQAAQRVLAAKPSTQFVLVGEGTLEAVARDAVMSLGLGADVVLAGYRTDVPQVLAALDVFVLPSVYEAMPYTLMEAMAAGRAIVATDVAGNRDLVQHGETGIMVSPGDASALAAGIMHLLSLPDERARLGRAAIAAARSRPTPGQMARQVMDLYAAVLQLEQDGE